MARASAARLSIRDLQRSLEAHFPGEIAAHRPSESPSGAARLPRTTVSRLERALSLGLIAAAAAALFLGQLVIALLNESPSSTLLWRLYFEFSRPLDVFYQLARGLFGETSLTGFATILLAVTAAAVAAIHSGIRLLRAIAYHGALAAAGALFYFTMVPSAAASPILGAWSPGVAAVASLFALLSLVQCMRVHGEYLSAAAGASRRLALAVGTIASPMPRSIAPRLAANAGSPRALPVRHAPTLPRPAKVHAAA